MNKKAGILYYTDNTLNRGLAKLCREYITHANLPITSVSLKRLDFGHNIHLKLERSYETLATQILTGLEAMTEDIVYFCEHDDLYHPNHFEFIPPEKNKFYYNGNYWFLREDGFAVHYNVSPLSGLVAYREPLLNHFRERLEMIKKDGYSFKMGFEPMTHHRIPWKYWYDFEIFMPEFPNIDICHGTNLTWKRFKKEDFRRKPKFWEESDIYHISGWSDLPDILNFKKPKSEKLGTPKLDDTLTIVIPARNEEFIGLTVEDILKNIEGNTDIIVALDGYTVPIPPIPQDKRVTILGYHESIGQRAATNNAVRLSKSKYIAKCDAHCAFDKGFDVKLMKRMQPDYTMVPIMRNLWAFDWKCKNGHTRYQGPSGPCKECGEPTFKDMKWIGKDSPQSTAYCFDSEPHFQYDNSRKKTKEYAEQLKTGLTETMSLQGSFWMLTRDKYWELDVCDESFGSWGSQGIQVAVSTWLSGGRVVCNHDTWYAHCFRTQGGDFGFPYELSGRQTERAKKLARSKLHENKWPKQIHPSSWLIEKFWPIPKTDKSRGWTSEALAELKKAETPLNNHKIKV